MIIRGGENVYPREIEEFLYTHPAIRDVQVVGVPDERYGEEIAALVIAREPGTIDAEAVREFCRGKIAHYQDPALRDLSGRVPDDGHWQDPEIQATRPSNRVA